MLVSDPIADLLTRIRNAVMAGNAQFKNEDGYCKDIER
jgi:ribosomal protein S8